MSDKIYITDLIPGDEILGWMRLGLALTKEVTGSGYVYMKVPDKPGSAKLSDLTRWVGTVVKNNVDEKVLTVRVTRTDSRANLGYNRDIYVADMSYTSLQRVRKFSVIHVPAREDNPTFPANLEDAAYKPFRTLTEVVIK